MEKQLSAEQCRVIGALLEKETTTPDQYPLSLNALTLACNQKSNREPVMQLSEAQVMDVLTELKDKRLVAEAPMSGRVERYQHRFCNTTFGGMQLSEQERAIICLLLLRGPQTPGELRTRSGRLCEFASVNDVDNCLHGLQHHQEGALVQKLAKEPGKREARFAHCFAELDQALQASAEDQPSAPAAASEMQEMQQQIDQLKEEVRTLQQQMAELLEDKSAWLS